MEHGVEHSFHFSHFPEFLPIEAAQRWQKYIDVNGEYFEGDKSSLSKIYKINFSQLTNDNFHLKLPFKNNQCEQVITFC